MTVHLLRRARSGSFLRLSGLLAALIVLFAWRWHERFGEQAEGSLVAPQPGMLVAGTQDMGEIIFVSPVDPYCDLCRNMWQQLAHLARAPSGDDGPAVHVLPVAPDLAAKAALTRWLCASIEDRMWEIVLADPKQENQPVAAAQAIGIRNVDDYMACLRDGRMNPRVNAFNEAARRMSDSVELPAAFTGMPELRRVELSDALEELKPRLPSGPATGLR